MNIGHETAQGVAGAWPHGRQPRGVCFAGEYGICATRFAADAAPGKIGLKPKDNVTQLFIVSQRAATDRTINGKITLRVALARPVGRRNRLHRTHLKTKSPAEKPRGFALNFVKRMKRKSVLGRPGGDLLFQALRLSTIGAEDFDGRVRDGIG